MECWTSSLILAIAAEAGRPISLDSFTVKQRKRGFARVKVELDAGQPLKPGVVVRAGEFSFWQQFQFENLPVVCYLCGILGHSEGSCSCCSSGVARGGEGSDGGVELGEGPRKPRLGPWITALRIRQPRVPPVGGTRRVGPDSGGGPSSSGPTSSPPAGKPASSFSPPGSPSDLEGWQKPPKVARKSKGLLFQGESSGGGGVAGLTPRSFSPAQTFAPLAALGDQMDLGVPPVVGVEVRMTDQDQMLLKRPRSPPSRSTLRKPALSESPRPTSSGSSKSSVNLPQMLAPVQGSSASGISSSVPPSVGQVCPVPEPCMPLLPVGGAGDGLPVLGGAAGGLELVSVDIGVAPELIGRGKGLSQGPVVGDSCVKGDLEGGVDGGGLPSVTSVDGGSGEGGSDRGKGKLALVSVDVREVVGASFGPAGGLFSSAKPVSLEGSAARSGRAGRGGRGVRGVRGARGLASGSRPGRARSREQGVVRDLSAGAVLDRPRSRSRSPPTGCGGEGAAGTVTGGGLSGRAVGDMGDHDGLVLGVRAALRVLEKGSGSGDSPGRGGGPDV